jgi:hypothetical protein
METNIRSFWLAFAIASLLLVSSTALAGGQIGTYSDEPFYYAGGGSMSHVCEAPCTAGAAFTVVDVEGDGANWEFSALTLNASGGIQASVAKQVKIRLPATNKHLVEPHDGSYSPNELPPIETNIEDVELGLARVFSAWNDVPHGMQGAEHKDYYTIGGTVGFAQDAADEELRILETNDAWVRAGHGRKHVPAKGPPLPPGFPPGWNWPTIHSNMRFDAEQGMLTIMPGHVVGGITPSDALWNAAMQEMNLQFSGQDETNAWRFHGTFALSSQYGKLSMESALDELRMVDPRDGYFVLNRGNATDGSQGASPWMNQLFSMLAGRAPTGVPNTMFGAPVLWFEAAADVGQLSDGFTVSTPWIPVQLTLWPSLVEFEAHEMPGDENGDGKVDAADYVAWLKMDASPAGYPEWRTHFGEAGGVGAALSAASNAVAVPEPAGALLLLLAAALCNSRRHRLRSST